MPRKLRRSKPSRTQPGPWASWSITDLILANLLRPEPLPLTQLTRYANHKSSSIHQIYSNLCRTGRITPDHRLNPDDPENAQLLQSGTAKSLPLPDAPVLSAIPLSAEQLALLRRNDALTAPQSDGTAPPIPTRATRRSMAAVLEAWIDSGKAGTNTPRFMEVWADLAASESEVGPPAPLTQPGITSRLLQLLNAVGPRALPAIHAFLATQPAPPEPASELHANDSQPGEAPPLPPQHDQGPLPQAEGQ